MNFQSMVFDLREVMTLKKIAELIGLKSLGHVHDLYSGRRKSLGYVAGVKLVDLHKREMRKRAREKAKLAKLAV